MVYDFVIYTGESTFYGHTFSYDEDEELLKHGGNVVVYLVKSMTPSTLAEMTPSTLLEILPSTLTEMTPSILAQMKPSTLAELTPSTLA